MRSLPDSLSRRGLMAPALPVLALAGPSVALAAATPHPDAALFALEPVILAALAARAPLGEILNRAELRSYAERTEDARRARQDIEADHDAATDRLFAASNALAAMRATTLDGLRLKARMAEAVGCEGTMPASIVADLLAMGGRA